MSDALEKDRDTLTDKINNGIMTMDKKVINEHVKKFFAAIEGKTD